MSDNFRTEVFEINFKFHRNADFRKTSKLKNLDEKSQVLFKFDANSSISLDWIRLATNLGFNPSWLNLIVFGFLSVSIEIDLLQTSCGFSAADLARESLNEPKASLDTVSKDINPDQFRKSPILCRLIFYPASKNCLQIFWASEWPRFSFPYKAFYFWRVD